MSELEQTKGPYAPFNGQETNAFCWDACQMGGAAIGIKAFYKGDEINVAWKNSITNETIAIEWDWRGKENSPPQVIDELRKTIIEQADRIAELEKSEWLANDTTKDVCCEMSVLKERIAELEGKLYQVADLIYNSAIGSLTMNYSVDIESIAQQVYSIIDIHAEDLNKKLAGDL